MRKLLLIIIILSSVASLGQTPLHKLIRRKQVSSTDSAKFIAATGITDATQRSNLGWLIDTLKTESIWSTGIAIYPLIGGTSTTHAYNLKDTGAYKLSYSGALTHASTGMKGNGSTGYANTSFNPTNNWSNTLGSIALYSRTSGVASGTITEMGASNATYTQNTSIFIRFADTRYSMVNDIGISTNSGNTESHGFYLGSRVAASGTNSCFIQKNGTQTNFSTSSAKPNLNLYICALNENGTAKNFSNKEFTFVWIGNTLTTAQATTLYNIVLRWNTKNSR